MTRPGIETWSTRTIGEHSTHLAKTLLGKMGICIIVLKVDSELLIMGNKNIYIYIYIYVCVCVCERERERERWG